MSLHIKIGWLKTLLLLLGTCCWNIYSQNSQIYHKILNNQDGLEIDAIRSMAFDNDGFLWLGGEILDIRTIINTTKKNGLQRYNGTTFHTVEFPETTSVITSVDQLFKRKDGKFYIHCNTSSGHILFLFDPVSMEFVEIDFTGFNLEVEVTSFIFQFKDTNYILLQNGRDIYMTILKDDLSIETLYNFTSNEIDFILDASTIMIPFNDFCLIGDNNFPIHFIGWEGNIIKKFSEDTFVQKVGNVYKKYFIDSYFEKNSTHYVFLRGNPKLHYIDTLSLKIVPAPIQANNFTNENVTTHVDSLGNTTILTANGDTLTFSSLESDEVNSYDFPRAFTKSSAMKLASKNSKEELWVGTGDGELHYFKFPSTKIKTFLPNHSIRAIIKKNKDHYIIATETKGWFEFNSKTGQLNPYKILRDNENYNPISARNIFTIKDKLWSNSSGRVIEIDTASRRTNVYRYWPVISFEKLNDSILIYGTNSFNLVAFNVNTKKQTPFVVTDSLYVYDITIHENTLVGATNKGVLKYDFSTKATQFINDKNLLHNDPFFLMVDYKEDHGFMLGSRSGNILTHDFNTESFDLAYHDSFEAGIATILTYDDTWWINTFNGFVAYDYKTGTAERFSVEDGFSDNEANRYSAIKTENGLLVGTLNGLNYFNPKDLQRENKQMELVLLKKKSYNTDLKKIETVYNRKLLGEDKTIELPAEFKDLEVEFSLTNMVTRNENNYYYRLDNEPWVSLKQKPSIRFANLAPGSYTLDIEARDFSEKRIGQPLQLKIISKNFFYKTWWFLSIVMLGFLLLALYLIKQAKLRVQMQEQFSEGLLQSQEEERTRIAKELHDSVGQQLTLIKKTAQNKQQEDITILTNTALEEIRSISRGLYPSVLKQLGLTESIEQLVYDLDEQTPLLFFSEVDDIDVYFSEKETLNFYRFIQESLHNIIKHSEATSVSIIIKKKGTLLNVKINDNGKGFDVSEKIKLNTLGLKTLSERIRILNGILTIDSKQGKGTHLVAEIPIQK